MCAFTFQFRFLFVCVFRVFCFFFLLCVAFFCACSVFCLCVLSVCVFRFGFRPVSVSCLFLHCLYLVFFEACISFFVFPMCVVCVSMFQSLCDLLALFVFDANFVVVNDSLNLGTRSTYVSTADARTTLD